MWIIFHIICLHKKQMKNKVKPLVINQNFAHIQIHINAMNKRLIRIEKILLIYWVRIIYRKFKNVK